MVLHPRRVGRRMPKDNLLSQAEIFTKLMMNDLILVCLPIYPN